MAVSSACRSAPGVTSARQLKLYQLASGTSRSCSRISGKRGGLLAVLGAGDHRLQPALFGQQRKPFGTVERRGACQPHGLQDINPVVIADCDHSNELLLTYFSEAPMPVAPDPVCTPARSSCPVRGG